jgi:integrase
MGRRRQHDKHLPQRVYFRGKTYYFVDRAGKWLALGHTAGEMYRTYAALVEERPLVTMGDLFDRYVAEVIPQKAPRTQRDNRYEMQFLRAALRKMPPSEFRPRDGYAYYNERKKTSLRRALAEMALLSHVFTKAIEWGAVEENPCREIRKERPKPRRRYVTEAEYAAAYKVMTPMAQCAMDLAVLTGLRPGDLLGLTRANLTDDGIEVTTSKTGKRLLIEWSEALGSAVKRALAQAPRVRQPIICNKQGAAYTVDGFNTIFYRAMGKALKDENSGLRERFQFRDLRAKSASDDTAEAASKRLGHADPKITERVYRRKAERAKPLR